MFIKNLPGQSVFSVAAERSRRTPVGVPASLKHQALAVHCANRLGTIKLCERRPAQGRRRRHDTGGSREKCTARWGTEEEGRRGGGWLIRWPHQAPGARWWAAGSDSAGPRFSCKLPGDRPAGCGLVSPHPLGWLARGCSALSSPILASICSHFLTPGSLPLSPAPAFPSLGDEYLEMVTPAEDSPQEAPAGTNLTPHFGLRLPWDLSLQQRFHQESLYQPCLGGLPGR